MPAGKPLEKTNVRALPSRGRPRSTGKEPERIAALDTALELTKIIARHEGKLSLSDLCRLSGEQPNKLHRYLASLKYHGFLIQSAETGLYDIGPQAHALGLAALRRYDPLSGVRAAVSEIANGSGYLTNLYVWTSLGPTLVMTEPGIHPLPVALKLGTALPLSQSATGVVFLAYMPEEATRGVLARELEMAAHDGVEVQLDRLNAEVEKARTSDVYWSVNAVITGTAAVLPLLNERGQLACAITTIMPRGSANPETKEALQRALLDIRDRTAGMER